MEAGKLRHRVSILTAPALVPDSRGQQTASATVLTKEWSSIVTLSGREAILARQVYPTATHRIGMRWVKGLDTADKMTLGSRTFNIEDMDNVDQRNIELVFTCTEVK